MEAKSGTDYETDWKDFQRRRRLCLIAALVAVPGVFLTEYGLYRIFLISPGAVERISSGIAIFWFTMIVAPSVYLTAIRCPRCKRIFDVGGLLFGFIACVHCGLRRPRRLLMRASEN